MNGKGNNSWVIADDVIEGYLKENSALLSREELANKRNELRKMASTKGSQRMALAFVCLIQAGNVDVAQDVKNILSKVQKLVDPSSSHKFHYKFKNEPSDAEYINWDGPVGVSVLLQNGIVGKIGDLVEDAKAYVKAFSILHKEKIPFKSWVTPKTHRAWQEMYLSFDPLLSSPLFEEPSVPSKTSETTKSAQTTEDNGILKRARKRVFAECGQFWREVKEFVGLSKT